MYTEHTRFVFVAVIELYDQRQLDEEGVYFAYRFEGIF